MATGDLSIGTIEVREGAVLRCEFCLQTTGKVERIAVYREGMIGSIAVWDAHRDCFTRNILGEEDGSASK